MIEFLAIVLFAEASVPDGVPWILGRAIDIGGTAGVLYVAIWFLVRTLKEQYDKRVGALEVAVAECDRDRRELHKQIDEIRSRQIEDLKQTAKVKI